MSCEVTVTPAMLTVSRTRRLLVRTASVLSEGPRSQRVTYPSEVVPSTKLVRTIVEVWTAVDEAATS